MRLAPVILALGLVSCSSFRAGVRDMGNSNLVGCAAPPLTEGAWVGQRPEPAGDWYLVAFLLPT